MSLFVMSLFVMPFLCFCLGPGPWGPWAHGPKPLGPMGPIIDTFGPGAGAGTPWARGLGAPGPKLQDTRGECNHLLSGRLSAAVRDAPKSRIHAPKSFRRYAPNIRILCTQQPHTLHPTTAYMHPTAPYTCTQNPHTCTQKSPHTCAQFLQQLAIFEKCKERAHTVD